jgi:ParB/RepB/Spo0J family partition protein
MAKLMELPVEVVEENPDALRTVVDKKGLKYQQLKNGIDSIGLLNPISVFEYKKADDTVGYRVCDGLHRLTAFRDLGKPTIPVNVVDIEDETKLLRAQIGGNSNIPTSRAEFAQALKKMIQLHGWTAKQCGVEVNQTERWVNEQLGLLDLAPDMLKLLDEGKLGVMNAMCLRRLPESVREEYLQAAMTETYEVFAPRVEQAIKDRRKAAMTGTKVEATFEAPIRARKKSELEPLITELNKTGAISSIRSLLDTQAITSPYDAAAAVLKWVLHLDPESVAIEKAKWDAEQKQKAADTERRKAEKEAAKAEKDKASVAATLNS